MKILSIESSCDETSAAVVEDGRKVLSNIISSQIDIHTKFGGVVPEVASRKHIENISIVVKKALEESKCTFDDIDAIAVTYGPGLVGALLVGLQYAKGLAYSLNKPLIAVNHTEGHISANYIEHKELEPPFITLVVSGGNTFIAHVKEYGEYEILGQTRDDAAGEAFDKVARSIGLGYPGGPKVDKVSKDGDENFIKFPKANFHDDKVLDFSFSGVKSAVLNYINSSKMKGETYKVEDIAASFQKSVVEVLVDNGIKACKNKKNYTIAVAGGVGCNSKLREVLKEKGEKSGIKVLFPSPVLCTDNAAMIGAAAYYQYMKIGATPLEVNATPNLKLGEVRY